MIEGERYRSPEDDPLDQTWRYICDKLAEPRTGTLLTVINYRDEDGSVHFVSGHILSYHEDSEGRKLSVAVHSHVLESPDAQRVRRDVIRDHFGRDHQSNDRTWFTRQERANRQFNAFLMTNDVLSLTGEQTQLETPNEPQTYTLEQLGRHPVVVFTPFSEDI